MKYKNLVSLSIIIGISILLIALLFIFQIIELKDLAINLVSILLLSGIVQYLFQKYSKKSELKNVINKHYNILFSFLDELFLEKSFASGRITFITKYIDENKKDYLKFFEFEKDEVTLPSAQNYRFLRNKYSVRFTYHFELPSIIILDKGITDDAKIPHEKALKLYNNLKKEIKTSIKREFEIKIK